MAKDDFPVVFEQLKTILKPYAERLTLKADIPETYYIDGPYSEKWKKPLFFGSAVVKKVEPELFNELAELTQKGAERFKQENPS